MATISFIIDQLLKALVRQNLLPGESLLHFGPFGITHFENTAGPFSLPLPIAFITILHTCIVVAALAAYVRFRTYRSGLSWILAGGLSNLIDRIFFQSTTDYFALPFHGYWNLADVAVLIGIILVVRTRPSPQTGA